MKTKINIFKTFAEAKQAQEYDHLYQVAVGLATVCDISLKTIREQKLQVLQDGVFPLEDFVIQNNIAIPDVNLYQQALAYWKSTTAWSSYYKYQDRFAYTKDHSDISWPWIEIDSSELIPLDAEGNEIIIEAE